MRKCTGTESGTLHSLPENHEVFMISLLSNWFIVIPNQQRHTDSAEASLDLNESAENPEPEDITEMFHNQQGKWTVLSV